MCDLVQKLFTALNMIKGFEVGMINPRKGLYIFYNSKVYRLEPVEIAGVTTLKKYLKERKRNNHD